MDRNSNNEKQNHDDDLVIVIDPWGKIGVVNNQKIETSCYFVDKTSGQKYIFLRHPREQIYDAKIHIRVEEEIKRYLKKSGELDVNKIKNIKILDGRDRCPKEGTADPNKPVIDAVKTVNEIFPNIKRTKIVSNVCSSVFVDEENTDLRVELFNAVNDKKWNQNHELSLYFTPLNEDATGIAYDTDKHKFKRKCGVLNPYLSGNEEVTKQNGKKVFIKPEKDELKFIRQEQIYKFRKNDKEEAQIAYYTRDFDLPQEVTMVGFEFPIYYYIKNKENSIKEQKGYCGIKEMQKYMQEYYNTCKNELNDFCNKHNTSTEELIENVATFGCTGIISNEKYTHSVECYLPRRIEKEKLQNKSEEKALNNELKSEKNSQECFVNPQEQPKYECCVKRFFKNLWKDVKDWFYYGFLGRSPNNGGATNTLKSGNYYQNQR